MMVIYTQSAGFYAGDSATISINDVEVDMIENAQGNFRGLHLVLVNPENGDVEFSRVFDTYVSSM